MVKGGLKSKMLRTSMAERYHPGLHVRMTRRLVPIVKAVFPQSNDSARTPVRVLHALGPADAEIYSYVLPDAAVVKRPPLPRTVLASKPHEDGTTSGVLGLILGNIKDDGVDNDPCKLVRDEDMEDPHGGW